MNIGQMIRERREKMDMSLESLAVKAGIGRNTLFEIERGYARPLLHTVELIAAALDCKFVLVDTMEVSHASRARY